MGFLQPYNTAYSAAGSDSPGFDEAPRWRLRYLISLCRDKPCIHLHVSMYWLYVCTVCMYMENETPHSQRLWRWRKDCIDKWHSRLHKGWNLSCQAFSLICVYNVWATLITWVRFSFAITAALLSATTAVWRSAYQSVCMAERLCSRECSRIDRSNERSLRLALRFS